MPTQKILFLCTGNYYRSRVAEALFNHLAIEDGLNWAAESRGLRPKPEEMALSPIAESYLTNQDIAHDLTAPIPKKLTADDLTSSALVVAAFESEHRPMVAKQFPLWEDQVLYWQVPDIDVSTPEEALPMLNDQVRKIFKLIKDGSMPKGCMTSGARN